jgi:hypothetical protein
MTVRVSRDIAAATRHIKHGILIRRDRQTKRYRRRIQIREARATLNEWRLPGQHFDRAHVSGSIAEKDPRGKIRYGESGRRLL